MIDRIRQGISLPEGVLGIGDDCAILPQKDGNDTLVSTDMLVEGSHFLLSGISPYDLGWKSAAVNLSDLAAMGARPLASFLSLALSPKVDAEWMDEFLRGYRGISEKYSCPLLGGDTTASKELVCINVAVLGEAPSGKAKLRSTACEGDLVCVSGFLGDSAAGLRLILNREEGNPYLLDRHRHPEPRVAEGLALCADPGVHAMMDISDGVASDLRHILKASGKGAVIDTRRIPVSSDLHDYCSEKGLDALELALCGGEDYELLFTISPEAEKRLKIKHFVIGRIEGPSETLRFEGTDKDYLGFRHF